MKKLLAVTIMALGLFAGTGVAANAQQTITSDEAASIAMQNQEGEILNIGLEHENDTLVYDVDMKTRQGRVELIIDAHTGDVMETKKPVKHSSEKK